MTTNYIAQHNLRCKALSIMYFVLSPLFWFIAWAFFRYIPEFVLWEFKIDLPSFYCNLFAVFSVIIVFVTGWKSHIKTNNMVDSLVDWNEQGLDCETGGAVAVNYYTSQVTGCAFFLSQLFLLAPLSLFRAVRYWKRQLPGGLQNEARIAAKLEELSQISKWQGLSEHPGDEATIIQLGIINLIDISTIPSIRFKAKAPNAVPHAL